AVAVPLAPSSSGEGLAAMLADAEPRLLFLDAGAERRFGAILPGEPHRIALERDAFDIWRAGAGTPAPVEVAPDAAFNIIYSSGTTGQPKGIVQSHAMRWQHIRRGQVTGYASDAVTLVSTPLYSNTTLVSLIPALAHGGTVVLMAKFDALEFLTLSEMHRVTHAMLVPVQYQRLLDNPDFDRFDLSSFRMKTCTSAPFAAALKADILRRWPGGLVEIYGMTEGGGTMTLAAHLFPDKLHTVGRPAEGHLVRLIDEQGTEVAQGTVGEVVGHSPSMMTRYLNQPEKTREAEWFDEAGRRYIRTGDIARFDEDGFLILLDRKKDMIISGGFNIYPSDLETVLRQHPDVVDAAVVGVPSVQWGETPVAFVTRAAGATTDAGELRHWFAGRVGKTQRLAELCIVDELPRSPIGKILKRELRDHYLASSD
ncbi:MAG TPA: class I adenylate-forming enzyme family protein, partial [Sphingopyxis sp.]|uniref:class I adenylate-forming enzyme family protein n=1 Tax=Sphingopyxis sp. TaxID=1908224 RepID=UPI002C9B6FBB